jgi:hypothetical protein
MLEDFTNDFIVDSDCYPETHLARFRLLILLGGEGCFTWRRKKPVHTSAHWYHLPSEMVRLVLSWSIQGIRRALQSGWNLPNSAKQHFRLNIYYSKARKRRIATLRPSNLSDLYFYINPPFARSFNRVLIIIWSISFFNSFYWFRPVVTTIPYLFTGLQENLINEI